MSTGTEERAILTLTIEGGSFNDMSLGRMGEVFSLLGDIAGKGSTLIKKSSHTIAIREGYPGGASKTSAREEDKEPRKDVDIPKPVMGNPPYKGISDD